MNCELSVITGCKGKSPGLLGIFLLFLVFASGLKGQGNNSLILTTDSLLAGKNNIFPGTDISGRWKMMNGDNKLWASPEYNDSAWPVRSSNFYIDSASGKGWTGIGWFRLSIFPDSAKELPHLGLSLFHFGASEIYLNGKKIAGFGKVGNSPGSEKGYNPLLNPISLPLIPGKDNLIAIRYSNFSIIDKTFGLFIPIYPSGILIKIVDINKAVQNRFDSFSQDITIQLILFSVLFTLSILHLLIFIYYSKSRPNLYYSLFALSMAIFFLLGFFMLVVRQPGPVKYLIVFQIYLICFVFSLFVTFLFSIYQPKMPRRIWVYHAVALILGTLVLATLFGSPTRIAFGAYILICLFEGLRVVILSLKKKLDGAKIIASGVAGFFLIIALFFISTLVSISFIPSWFLIFILYLGFLSIPASMSLYLARNIAKTNENLEVKFNEVKELSEQALHQQRLEAELRLQNERKAKELEDARQVQLSMLPKILPASNDYEIAVFMQTAAEVGGDYYDFHLSGNELTVVLGDATGHGAKAGLMVTTAKTLFTSYASEPNIVEALKKMSRTIKSMNLGMLYMAMSLFKFSGNKVRYTSAGMPPVFRINCTGGEVEEFSLKAMPLGAFNEFPYGENEFTLKSGDTVFLMTDGFPELMNKSGQLLEYSNVAEILKKYASLSPNKIIEHLRQEINSWLDGASQNDDITFIVIKKK